MGVSCLGEKVRGFSRSWYQGIWNFLCFSTVWLKFHLCECRPNSQVLFEDTHTIASFFFSPVAKVLLVIMAKVNFAAISIYHPAAKVMRFCNIVLPRSKEYQYVLLPRQCSVYPEACGNKSSFHFLSLILLLMYHEIIDPNYEFMCLHQTGGLQA